MAIIDGNKYEMGEVTTAKINLMFRKQMEVSEEAISESVVVICEELERLESINNTLMTQWIDRDRSAK